MGDEPLEPEPLNDQAATDDNARLAGVFGRGGVSKAELDTFKAHLRAKPKDSDFQRQNREKIVKGLTKDVGGNKPLDQSLEKGQIKIGDASANVIIGQEKIESNIGDAANSGFSFDSKGGGEIRTGGLPLQRDVTTDKDIYSDGKARNRKESFGPNHIVDPYPPLLSSAPVWLQGLMRGAVAAIVVVLKELQEAEK